VPDVAPLPMASGQVTIGCLASQYKLTDQVIEVWASILGRCPAARRSIRRMMRPAEAVLTICLLLTALAVWLYGAASSH